MQLMDKVILNIRNVDNIALAARAAKFRLERPERIDALLDYENVARDYVKQNKKSISVWEQ